MRLRVAVTDYEWYQYLKTLSPDEVNFWRPGGGQKFNALNQNELLLFKLHSPQDFIVGGGFFIKYSALPVSLAWETFQYKNGVESYEELIKRIKKYRGQQLSSPDPIIGCIILAEPFFFEKDEWIPVPKDWSGNIVQGKNYDETTVEGRKLFAALEVRIKSHQTNTLFITLNKRYGKEQIIKPRIGQGAFRVMVTDAYEKKCAITGEKTLPVLEAAHIKPFALEGPNTINNGLLLREDIHTLFDLGYITITEQYKIEISKKIKEDYGNGREYYALHGSQLKTIPARMNEQPLSEYLRWHNENRFTG